MLVMSEIKRVSSSLLFFIFFFRGQKQDFLCFAYGMRMCIFYLKNVKQLMLLIMLLMLYRLVKQQRFPAICISEKLLPFFWKYSQKQ